MTKQEIIDYVMTTPSNPNKAVLEGMLDSIANAGGGGDEYRSRIEATLEHAIIPQGTTKIGDFAFDYLTSLKSVQIPDSVSSIGSNAFANSGLETVLIPGNVKTIGFRAFAQISNLESATIENGVTSLDDNVFYGCASLKTVQLPDGLEQIGKSCFERCTALTGMNIIPNSVTSLGSGAFSGCTALANVTLPSGLTSIPNTLLSQTAIESIVIPSGVTSIGTSAFYSCPKLKTIDIPSGVTSIGNSAFGECPLESITVRAIVPPTLGGSNVFNRVPSTCPIYVPSESVSAYKAATYWKTRASYIQAIAE